MLKMISKEAKKFILNITVLLLYTNHVKASADCGNPYERQLYSEIGCEPIYGDGGGPNNACPVAYDCARVFARPRNKCHFNGHVYEPNARLSVADSATAPCVTNSVCEQETIGNETITQFSFDHATCTQKNRTLVENDECYYEFVKGSCCNYNLRCPKKNEKVHECVYDDITYKNGELIQIDNYLQCICSPDFNGTVTDRSCRKDGCNYEILHMEKILNRNAPVWKGLTHCPYKWYSSDLDVVTHVAQPDPVLSKKSAEKCKYGDRSFSLGQHVTIGPQSDIWCSCETPPLITCKSMLRF